MTIKMDMGETNMQKVYSICKDKWENEINNICITNHQLDVIEVSRGIVLPIIRRDDEQSRRCYDGLFSGGVADEKGRFVAGLFRNSKTDNANLSVNKSYTVNQNELDYFDEEVIFGGVIFAHFGHMLTDSMTRLWYLANRLAGNKKIIFLKIPKQNPKYAALFDLIGLKEDDYRFIDKPTMFKKVIVPEESAHFLNTAETGTLSIYDLIKNNALEKYHDNHSPKIYLTRSNFSKSDINERYYESFYEKRGFEVISLEKHDLYEQVGIIAKADQIVCSVGTLSHMALFAHSGAKLTCLLRKPSTLVPQQIVINKLKDIEAFYFDATKNVLPTKHQGLLMFYPTEFFKQYLDDNEISYENNEIVLSKEEEKDLILTYLYKWADYYANPKRQKSLRNVGIIDFIVDLNYALYGKQIDRSTLFKPDGNLKELEDIKNSKSWRYTAPIRKLKHLIKKK